MEGRTKWRGKKGRSGWEEGKIGEERNEAGEGKVANKERRDRKNKSGGREGGIGRKRGV